MKKRGRPVTVLNEEEIRVIEEFFTNDLSYEEQAAKMGISRSALSYRIQKYRKEKKANGEKE